MPIRNLPGQLRLLLLAGVLANALAFADGTNLVTNGSFELDADQNRVPDHWQSAGDADTRQQLSTDTGRTDAHSAKLVCTQMGKDSPSSHAMICQVGRVSVQRGQWYRLSFWTKAEGIRNGAAYVGLNNTKVWKNAGLDDGFYPTSKWQRFEYIFQAQETLPAEASRLQFWFKSTGTLWLDDVELMETAGGRQWQPQLSTDGVVNFIPNSSFECGTANWGSYNNEPGGWGNQLFRLVGDVARTGGWQGVSCMKIELDSKTAPVFCFDYFDAVRRPVRRALAANQGWFKVKPGEPLVLSTYLRAMLYDTPAQLAIIQAEGRTLSRNVQVGTEWQRFEFNFKPEKPFIFIAVGLDLEGSIMEATTLWLDAVQLERGTQATAYQPRQPVESFVESITPNASKPRPQLMSDSAMPGNIFINASLDLVIRAYNYSDQPQVVTGTLSLADFANQAVREYTKNWQLPPRQNGIWQLGNLCPGRFGFFRATWNTPDFTNQIRCAAIVSDIGADSPFGMNHAYPWDFLVQSANQAGISWWRDWSAKWHVVEPEKGRFDFSASDPQIRRVKDLGGRALVLLPFPSSSWSSPYRPETDANPPKNDYERRRKPIAYAPKDITDFERYAAAVTRQYRDQARTYQILNEPLYTDYSLPRAYGYKMEDYLKMVEAGYRGIKSVATNCLVVGGIGTGPDAGLSLEFIEKGGLPFVDVFDLHMYSPPVPATVYEEAFAKLEALMKQHGGPKPIWITEYGCYADDDPACVPVTIGDTAMNRSKWPSEQAAAEHIVKFTAVTFAHGVRKIFFHAGGSAQINGVDGSGVFFEYGGTPRKMYPAVAALTRLLGTPDESLGTIVKGDVRAYLYRRGESSVAITWSTTVKETTVKLANNVVAFDIMGNRIITREITIGATPVYLLESSRDAKAIRASFSPP